MNMKAKAESLGSGFYLSIILLFVAGIIWNLLEPRRIDSEMLALITGSSSTAYENDTGTSPSNSIIPLAESNDQNFQAQLQRNLNQALALNQNVPIVIAALLECSLQSERSIGQRFQCASMATNLDKDSSHQFRAQIKGAQKKWPREIKKQLPVHF
jgi:hypothetical protein